MATGYKKSPDSSSDDFSSVTPNDSTDIDETRYLYVGGTGNLVCHNQNGLPVTFSALPVGWHPIRTKRILSTGTTATAIVAMR